MLICNEMGGTQEEKTQSIEMETDYKMRDNVQLTVE